jgi:hypothetical protein
LPYFHALNMVLEVICVNHQKHHQPVMNLKLKKLKL